MTYFQLDNNFQAFSADGNTVHHSSEVFRVKNPDRFSNAMKDIGAKVVDLQDTPKWMEEARKGE